MGKERGDKVGTGQESAFQSLDSEPETPGWVSLGQVLYLCESQMLPFEREDNNIYTTEWWEW